MKELDTHFVDDRINGTGHSSAKSEKIRPGREAERGSETSQLKFSHGDEKNACHHQANSDGPFEGKDFSDKPDGPDLSEKGSGARDGVDQREVSQTIGLEEADEIKRLDKTGQEWEYPGFDRKLEQQNREMAESDEEGEVKKDSPEENPKEEFEWPIPSLGKEVPGGVKKGRNEDEEDAQRRQGLTRCSWE